MQKSEGEEKNYNSTVLLKAFSYTSVKHIPLIIIMFYLALNSPLV